MNIDNHQNNSRPRPQAVPEIVSLSSRQIARLASDSDFRGPIASGEGVSASADAVHPVGKSAAANPHVIVEVAPQKPAVAASANGKVAASRRSIGGGDQIIVEMSPDVTPLHPKLSASRRSINGGGGDQVIVEVAPQKPPVAASATRGKLNPRRNSAIQTTIVEVSPDLSTAATVLPRGRQIIVEMSPDVKALHPTLNARRGSTGGQTIVEVVPQKPPSSASLNLTQRNTRSIIKPTTIVEISPDLPPSSIGAARNSIEPQIASDLKPLISKAN